MALGNGSFRGVTILVLLACIQLMYSGFHPVAAAGKGGMQKKKGMHKKGGMHPGRLSQQRITSEAFGATPEGTKLRLYHLRSGRFRADITNFGGALVRMVVPNIRGTLADVVSGYDNPTDYLTRQQNNNHGCLIGRYANRISGHSFKIGLKTYTLEDTGGNTTLHSGKSNYCTKVWTATPSVSSWGVSLILTYNSTAGQGGFPGTLLVKASYTLSQNRLWLTIEATTDKTTQVNIVHHPYFNLGGSPPGKNLTKSALQHSLQLKCTRYTPSSSTTVVTGQILPVAGTPFDFRTPKVMGTAMAANGGQGFDNNFVVDIAPAPNGMIYPLAAVLRDPVSGRMLNIYTNQPGIQLYTAGHFSGKPGKGGIPYPSRSFIALETQHFPDSPNHPNFPTTILKQGTLWRSATIYEFVATVPSKTFH